MATYKVLQDVEAEDKLIGPLTLRQFIYAGIAAVFLYLSYFVATHGAAFVMVFFLPIALFTGLLAFPWGRDQPTEVWALAKIRFMLKPRRRIWDQSGVKELVTITAPKQIITNYANNLSQDEVHSRLQALATTIDTRGWAVKNSGVSMSQIDPMANSDRLVGPTLLPKPVDDADIRASDDIMDAQNNASAQRLQSMIDKSAQDHRNKIMENLKNDAPAPAGKPADYWFLNQPAQPASIPDNMVTFNTQVVTPGAANNGSSSPTSPTDEATIMADLEAHKLKASEGAYYGHMHTIKPLSEQAHEVPPGVPVPLTSAQLAAQATAAPVAQPQPAATPAQSASAPVTPANQAAILQLANNDDLNVATIAREAERSAPQNEVVIKLH